jgi:hypothetical protein
MMEALAVEEVEKQHHLEVQAQVQKEMTEEQVVQFLTQLQEVEEVLVRLVLIKLLILVVLVV